MDQHIPPQPPSVEFWTAEDAKRALASNTDNYRRLKPTLVERYERDMRKGQWLYTGDPIKFDERGILSDGQNRLTAQVNAGVDLWWAVVRDLPKGATMVIDTGGPRTAADHLKHLGHVNGGNLAAVARLIISKMPGRDYNRGSISVSEINALIDEDDNLIKIATELVHSVPQLAKKATPMVTCYVWWLLAQIDTFRAAEFMHRANSLENLPRLSPILALNRRLEAIRGTRGAGNAVRDERIATMIYAWNAWVRGQTRENLKTVSREVAGANGRVYRSIYIPTPVKPSDVTFSEEQGVE